MGLKPDCSHKDWYFEKLWTFKCSNKPDTRSVDAQAFSIGYFSFDLVFSALVLRSDDPLLYIHHVGTILG